MRDEQGNHIPFPTYHAFSALLIVAMLVMATAQSCASRKEQSYAGITLAGDHQLRKMVNIKSTDASGSFFLFVGSFAQHETLKVSFAWKLNDGTYAISTLPMDKIRVRIDNNITVPTIKFRWRSGYFREIQDMMDYKVIYAVITCKDSDWPQQINLPLQ